MREIRLVLSWLGAIALCGIHAEAIRAQPVFINEIHYDNVGVDEGEAVEIAGPAGTDLTGWSIVLYNGIPGTFYEILSLAGTLPNQTGTGFGFLVVETSGIQNGSPDGIALVDDTSFVLQVLSYEGFFLTAGGPAGGFQTADIGVSEGGLDPPGFSLQLSGTGSVYSDFTWLGTQLATFGSQNEGQTFVPETTALGGSAAALAALGVFSWRTRRRAQPRSSTAAAWTA